jgi:hypothetical protein
MAQAYFAAWYSARMESFSAFGPSLTLIWLGLVWWIWVSDLAVAPQSLDWIYLALPEWHVLLLSFSLITWLAKSSRKMAMSLWCPFK